MHADDRYTFGPALRTPGVKNVGRDLGLGELRTCPGSQGRPRRPENFVDFHPKKPKSFKQKIARCARQETTTSITDVVISPPDREK